MPKKFSDEEYYKMLPKKQVGTAVLLFNTSGELLIVKPDYKDSWLVPGGSADVNESPSHCAIRETKEEIGLVISDIQLVGVYFAPAKGLHSDSLKFIFSGGTLSDAQISQIRLQGKELEKYMFLIPEEAISLMSPSLQASIPFCLKALQEGTVAYVEARVS